ncbi:hypothetical protein GCM10025864_22980 [Luteimicrobium album]|uniref:Lipopolysaccharide assembly protein A domain-containing protein n=1 Tax=Luteimicrobium album TaxID=1054550 RepID=A0ABQ6I3K1_9MICO|nr:LapA family protein [Luteimicrobium album]GMA24539.1 hypothetical protein GCM10025864_22980 [Luteimicrobium album]
MGSRPSNLGKEGIMPVSPQSSTSAPGPVTVPQTTPPTSGPALVPATKETSRPAARFWVGLVLVAVVVVALLIFLLQNTANAQVSFLGWSGSVPLALSLLVTAVGVAFIALVLAEIRVGRVRRRARRGRTL